MFKKFIIMLVALSIIISLVGCTGGIVNPPQDDDNSLQIEQEFQDNQEMITHHLEEIAEQGKTPEQYAQELAALLMNESQVSKVKVSGNSVNLTYASGKIHFIRFTDKEEGDEGYLIGGGSLHSSSALRDLLFKERDEVLFRGSSYQQREESSAIPLEERTIGIQDFTKSDQVRQTSSQEKLLQNRNILVWSPFTIYADALYLDLVLRLAGEVHLGFDIDLIRYKEATMDSLKEITNYGMVFLFAHGILPDGDSIETGEEITKDNEYKMYIEGVGYTSEWKIISTPPFIEKKPDHFTVDYEWISKNVPKNANNKIVIANSCHLGNENMWEAFKSIGAGDYFGWDADCTLPCVINRSADLLLKLKYGDSNTEDAYEPYSCSPYGANWLRFGDPVRFAASNNPPIISSLSANPSSIDINQTTTITCAASDQDGDTLIYAWTKTGGTFEGSTTSSSITWRAPSTQGNYTITCEVSDGKASDSEQITISVGDVNHPPQINSDPVTSATKDEPYSYDVDATDSDGDTLTYSLTTKPSGMTINSSTGLITWTPTTSGYYNVTVKVSDGELNDTQSFTITVEEAGTYALRDIGPAGGYIFYDKGYYSSGWRYLEAAPASTQWAGKQWGSSGSFIGVTETAIGSGESNTSIIVLWLNSHGETDRAAQLCDTLIYGGCNDWFLPSQGELNLMYSNLKVYGVGGFGFGNWWSSSEYSDLDSCARSVDFGDGYNGVYHKNENFIVRAARAF